MVPHNQMPVEGARTQQARLVAALVRLGAAFELRMRLESKDFALCSSDRRTALSPRPALFRKYVSMRIPDGGPLGETFLEASTRAIVGALFVNRPAGGWVESVFTLATQRFLFFKATRPSSVIPTSRDFPNRTYEFYAARQYGHPCRLQPAFVVGRLTGAQG